MKIYLVRHGKTEWNRDKKFQGHKNSPLLKEGKEQAQLLGERLKKHEFAGCYCSPLERTCETARLLDLPHDFKVDKAFMEINLGLLEGETFGKTEAHLEKIIDNFWNSPHTFDKVLTGGEDFRDIQKRSIGRIEELVSNHNEDDRVLIVSHGALIKGILNHYQGKPLKDFWEPPMVQPASLTILGFKEKRFKEIESLGDTSHYT